MLQTRLISALIQKVIMVIKVIVVIGFHLITLIAQPAGRQAGQPFTFIKIAQFTPFPV